MRDRLAEVVEGVMRERRRPSAGRAWEFRVGQRLAGGGDLPCLATFLDQALACAYAEALAARLKRRDVEAKVYVRTRTGGLHGRLVAVYG